MRGEERGNKTNKRKQTGKEERGEKEVGEE